MESDNYSVLYTISEDSITEEVESNVKNEIIVTEIDAGICNILSKGPLRGACNRNLGFFLFKCVRNSICTQTTVVVS